MSSARPMGDARNMLSRLGIERGVALSAGIEISDHCNETCAHCYQVGQGQNSEDVPTAGDLSADRRDSHRWEYCCSHWLAVRQRCAKTF